MARRRRSYAWSLAFSEGDRELAWLSEEGRLGLGYAQKLARNARKRRQAGLDDDVAPDRLTVAKIAYWEVLSLVHVNQRIKQARIELFGKDLSDRAIVDRMCRRLDAASQSCAVKGCRNPFPRYATAGKEYCDEHAAVAARVRRLRAGLREASVADGGAQWPAGLQNR